MAHRRRSSVSTLDTAADIAAGITALRRTCRNLARVHDLVGDPPLRRHTAGFEGLARIIVAQQVSAASAAAIWDRARIAFQPLVPQTILALDDGALRAPGLSRPKVRTLRALATAVTNEGLDIEALTLADDAAVHSALTSVSGIGPWTADIYLMFCLGRADSFPAGDLALQTVTQQVYSLRQRPDREQLLVLAEGWRPWRAVAAHLMWAYHARTRQTLASPSRPRRQKSEKRARTSL